MSGGARIAAFAVALAAVFGAALALGRAVAPAERGAPAHAEADHGVPTAEGAATASEPSGLSVAANGLRLDAPKTTLAAGRDHDFTFRVLRGDGSPLRAYDLAHERRMHLIVVRRDLTQFQHLHPRMRADGTWAVTLPGLVPGAYRAFADFASGGRKTTLGIDLFVPGDWEPLALARPSVVSGYAGEFAVELLHGERLAGRETELRFDVRGPDRRPAALEPYLGARGHLVILRAGDLGYLHNHAEQDELTFATTFPSAGRYRAFLQFSVGGRVRMAPFTLEVEG